MEPPLIQVTSHALRRYRKRIWDCTGEQAETEILRGIAGPLWELEGRRQGVMLYGCCVQEHCFVAVVHWSVSPIKVLTVGSRAHYPSLEPLWEYGRKHHPVEYARRREWRRFQRQEQEYA